VKTTATRMKRTPVTSQTCGAHATGDERATGGREIDVTSYVENSVGDA
jgi:hypothetical protein